jgi:preprotein translocase subunit SecF
VTTKALIALAVFLAVIVVYVSIRFDFKMSVSALVALIHDLLITAGVYALARFEVTPATVIGLLTILGYSLYDTVVVFDKVRENTGELSSMSRLTYSEAANRAVNQTLVRSLNTSLTSLLPIAALLTIGLLLPGAETIKDLSLALFVGVAAGTYSSVFIATPFLALWKETEPRNRQLRARVARLAASGAAEEVPARPRQVAGRSSRAVEAGAGAGGQRRGDAGRRRQERAPVLEEEQTPTGLHLEPDRDEEIEEAGEPAPARAAAPAPRQGQKPRPAQQRRKSSGRKPSSSAKRRRR